jgi:hypothetical protein
MHAVQQKKHSFLATSLAFYQKKGPQTIRLRYFFTQSNPTVYWLVIEEMGKHFLMAWPEILHFIGVSPC